MHRLLLFCWQQGHLPHESFYLLLTERDKAENALLAAVVSGVPLAQTGPDCQCGRLDEAMF